ncbi:MAG TPA: hypothetical protein VFV07_02680 [Rhizomicrobium sp.]|nr:hypothetical protein [Rhizomicrobium sp.]
MTRLGAALFAGTISVLLFAGAIGLVDALLGSAAFWHVVGSRSFIGWSVAWNCFVMPFGVWFLIFRSGRTAKDEPLQPLTPLIRRSPVTGQREL